MRPEDYSREFIGSIYEEVLFAIEPEQFDDETIEAPEGAYDELKDVKAEAQAIADKHNVTVSVEVYGRWGYYGRENIEYLKFKPACPIQGIRDDLAALGL